MNLVLDTQKKSIAMSVVIFLLTTFVGYNLIYATNTKKMNQIKRISEDARNINRLVDDINKFQDKVEIYKAVRADKPDPSWFLTKAVDSANVCGIKIDSVTPGKSITEGRFTYLPCMIKFVTPYHKLRLFINNLENDKKFIRIESLSITPIKTSKQQQEQSESGLLRVSSAEFAPPANIMVIKKNKDNGVWAQVRMEIVGFYFE